MSVEGGREKIIQSFLEAAKKRWGEGEARTLRPALERIAEAVWRVECFELGVEEGSSNPPVEGG
jgi:hypothetical protein